jgi:hypothetical protein
MKIIDEKTIYRKVIKHYAIETTKGVIKIETADILDDFGGDYESGYEVLTGQPLIDSMEDEEKDELDDFINSLQD